MPKDCRAAQLAHLVGADSESRTLTLRGTRIHVDARLSAETIFTSDSGATGNKSSVSNTGVSVSGTIDVNAMRTARGAQHRNRVLISHAFADGCRCTTIASASIGSVGTVAEVITAKPAVVGAVVQRTDIVDGRHDEHAPRLRLHGEPRGREQRNRAATAREYIERAACGLSGVLLLCVLHRLHFGYRSFKLTVLPLLKPLHR